MIEGSPAWPRARTYPPVMTTEVPENSRRRSFDPWDQIESGTDLDLGWRM